MSELLRKLLTKELGNIWNLSTNTNLHTAVVQLGIERNHRCSSEEYKGVARVTTTKGFMLKNNPDTHWSSALYKGLNFFSSLMDQMR